ncbi:acyl-ACP--UDP-N-acetylglucosamine O-acyltransferase [Desulfobacterales bacterium HSG17]|nr:acyl-ACP--UDP-N-acetylglucosamine O-acyltransferase [Desulfobacterales bacterium HSG17]
MVHPTAIVHKNAEIGNNVDIGAFSIIGDNVFIGDDTVIGPHVVIDPYVEIGPKCRIFQYAAIGAIPQAVRFEEGETWVKIGAESVIREFVTIHRGTDFGGGITEVGEKNLVMAYTHVAHDCRIGKEVIMSNNTTLAGHIEIGDFATIGGLVAIHQFVRVGAYAFVGGKSAVVKDIPPFVIASGDRAKLHGLNKVGLRRRGISDESINRLKKTYRLLFRVGLTINEAMERIRAEVEADPVVYQMIDFIKTSERGITR